MNSNGIDDFKYPRHRPWLLIGIVVALGVFLLVRVYGIKFPRSEEKAVPASGDTKEQPLPLKKAPVAVPLGEKAQPEAQPKQPAVTRTPVAVGTAPARNTEVEKARELDSKGRFLEARETYLSVLGGMQPGSVRDGVEKRLGEINVALVTSFQPMPEKMDYVVQRGDSVQKIAKKFGTTDDLVFLQNGLRTNEFLRVGDKFKVLKGTFAIEISKSRNDMVVKLNDRFFKRYAVATGKEGKTPIGTFVITAQKEKQPTWWKDNKAIPYGHPENILGTRWMAIRATGTTPEARGYGIHGTWDDKSIGKAESAGCIRMHNKDVEELFVLVPPGTAVTIAE